MKKSKKIVLTLIAFLLLLTAIACGAKQAAESAVSTAANYSYSKSAGFDGVMAESASMYADNGYYESETYYPEADYYYKEGSSGNVSQAFNDSARKLIKTFNLNVETEEFEKFLASLEERIISMGGYVESENTYNGEARYNYKSSRYSNITARIPAVNAENFKQFVGQNSNVTNESLSVQDVTTQYVDIESQKAAYKIEQERLLSYLEKAANVEEIISIESRLSEVRYRLESYESQLRMYDNLVDYSTFYLTINEVVEYTAPEPETFGERVSRAFSEGIESVQNGFKDFTVDFMYSLPGLVVFLVFAGIIVAVVVAIVKANKKRRAAKAEKRASELMATAQNTASEKAKLNE